MKKVVAAILFAAVVVGGLSAKSLKDLAKGAAKKALGASDSTEEKKPESVPLKSEDALYIFFKATGTDLTDEYLPYAKVVEGDTYIKYHNDPFEWEDKFAQCKKNFDEKVANADLNQFYSVGTSINFGDYDFDKQGYKVTIGAGTYFPMKSVADVYTSWYGNRTPGNDSYFVNEIGLKIQDLDKYNFIPMEKDAAKTFLQSRRYSDGSFNKKVTIFFKYKLAAFDSQEYNTFAASIANENKIPLVGIIEGPIEVYDTTNNATKKIGELVIK